MAVTGSVAARGSGGLGLLPGLHAAQREGTQVGGAVGAQRSAGFPVSRHSSGSTRIASRFVPRTTAALTSVASRHMYCTAGLR